MTRRLLRLPIDALPHAGPTIRRPGDHPASRPTPATEPAELTTAERAEQPATEPATERGTAWALDIRWPPGRSNHLAPAARRVLEQARRDGYTRAVTGSCGPWGLAVARAATALGMEATIVLPDAARGRGTRFPTNTRVVRSGTTHGDVTAASRTRQRSSRARVDVGGPYGHLIIERLRQAAESFARRWDAPVPATLWVPLGSGATVTGLGAGLLAAGWATAVIGIGDDANSIVTSWPDQHHPVPVDTGPVPALERPLARAAAEHGAAAISVLTGTGGAAASVHRNDQARAVEVLARRGMPASPTGAAGVAGLIRAATAPDGLPPGHHVAVVSG